MTWLPAYDVVGAAPGAATLFLMHGILGNRHNWRSFAQLLAGALPGVSVVVVDHRGHGDSHGASPPDTVAACADDLAALAAALGVRPWVTVGHSFSGKVVLEHVSRHPAAAPEQVWVLDSPPGPGVRCGEDHEVRRVMAALREVPLPLQRRAHIVEFFEARGLSRDMGLWMTTNLKQVPGGFRFRFELEGCQRLLEDYFGVDGWPVLLAPRAGPRIELVIAERSDRWGGETLAPWLRLAPGVPTRRHVLANAGHWLHADNPRGLRELMVQYLPGRATETSSAAPAAPGA